MLVKIAFLIDEFFKNMQDTFFTVLAFLFLFRYNKFPKINFEKDSCVVLGNGPSLKKDYKYLLDFIYNKDVICLNDFALSEKFFQIRPKYYVLQDPYYWEDGIPEKFEKMRHELYCNISKTNWNLILFLPWEMKKIAVPLKHFFENPNISIYYYNRMPITGYKWFRYFCFKHLLGIPSGQNILITAIFFSLKLYYKIVYIAGADHSLHENIVVREDNIVCVKQIHFYDKNISLKYEPYSRSYIKYKPIKIHELFTIWSKAFKEYIELNDYALRLNKKIYNISSKSYIDAFERLNIESCPPHKINNNK